MISYFSYILVFIVAFPSLLLSTQNAPILSADQDNQQPFKTSEWMYRNEEHWVVDQICRDIAEMLAYAADKNTAPVIVKTEPLSDQPHVYAVTITCRGQQAFKGSVALKEYLWHPSALVALIQQLSKAWNIAPQDDSNVTDSALIEELLTPTPVRLEQAQMKVSEMLTHHPRSPRWHEQAAFCLAVFGLFNCGSDIYTDNRHTLNRLAAHLAIAKAWHHSDLPPTSANIISEIALLHLVGRTAQAVKLVNIQLKQHPPEPLLRTWLNVLHLAASTDWRLVTDPRKVTEVERLMAFYARVHWIGQMQAQEWLAESGSKAFLPFVRRIMLVQRIGPSKSGDTFAKEALNAELENLHDVLKLHQIEASGHSSSLELTNLLNTRPERALDPQGKRIVVIGRGMWARYFQANILFFLDRIISSIEEGLGDHEQAIDFIKTCERNYSGLELYPVLMKRYSNIRGEQDSAISKFAAIVRKSPELISDGAFVYMCQPPPNLGKLPPSLPNYREWLNLPFPFGTTYGGYQRVRELIETNQFRLEEILSFLELNPYHAPLIKRLTQLTEDNHPTLELIEKLFAETRDFAGREYLNALRQISYDNPESYIKYTRELTLIDPCEYFKLGNYLAELGRDEEAKQAYLDGEEKCNDIVFISNNLEWISTYLFMNGQQSKAELLSRKAGQVGSEIGLATWAKFLELKGDLSAAEEKLKEIKKRYKSYYRLDYFYLRNKEKYPSEAQKIIDKVFPEGLRYFDPQTDTPPLFGIKLKSQSQTTKRFGIPRSAILVAIDNYALKTKEQYYALLNYSLDCDITFTFFADDHYRKCTSKVYVRRLNVRDIEEYSRQ